MILNHTNFDVVKKLYDMFSVVNFTTFDFTFMINSDSYIYNAINKRIKSKTFNMIYTGKVESANFNDVNIHVPEDINGLVRFIIDNDIPSVNIIDFEHYKTFIYNGQHVSLTDGDLLIDYKLVAMYSKKNDTIETHLYNMSKTSLQIYISCIKHIMNIK
jgi:hypothetical protein